MMYATDSGVTIQSDHAVLFQDKSFVSTRIASLWKNRKSCGGYEATTFIALELSLVPEVESVFVDEPASKQKVLRVITIIGDRNNDARRRIYAREQDIISAFPWLDFNFRVIARSNRNLADIVERVGKLVYQKR